MTLTKKRKKILFISIPSAVVVIAAAVTAAVLLLRPQPQGPHLAQAYEDQNNPMFVVVDGKEREDFVPPLPLYGLELPESWNCDEDAATVSNRFSSYYQDIYRDDEGMTITFTQDFAYNYRQVMVPGMLQKVRFQDMDVICFQSDVDQEGKTAPNSGAVWIYGDTLFSLTCDRALETDSIMELVGLVQYDTQREPIYSPFYFKCTSGRNGYVVEGNPEIPEDLKWYYFTQPPEGYDVIHYADSNDIQLSYGLTGLSEQCDYENANGDTIILANWTYRNSVLHISWEELTDPEAVEEVVIQGRDGLIHINDEISEIVWFVSDSCYISICCTAPMTRQELLDLAATVSQDAEPPVVGQS